MRFLRRFAQIVLSYMAKMRAISSSIFVGLKNYEVLCSNETSERKDSIDKNLSLYNGAACGADEL